MSSWLRKWLRSSKSPSRPCVFGWKHAISYKFGTARDPEIGENLNYDGPIFYIKRIFRVNGNPIAVNRIWLPEKFTPQLDIVGLCVDNSLSKTLSQHYGIKILHRTNIVEAVRPSPTEVDLLKITYDTLILQISSTSFTENNVPYEFSRTSWIGDAIRLKVDVTDIEHSLEIAT